MPTDHILNLLISERDKLNRAIAALQGTSRGGRPFKSAIRTSDATPAPTHKPKRRRWTAAMKLAASGRSKSMWAAKRRKAARKG